ncbi:MAG: sulfatase [Planctomycetes bacterium]|nr:sulfatase [Planctomycetota bacterium]
MTKLQAVLLPLFLVCLILFGGCGSEDGTGDENPDQATDAPSNDGAEPTPINSDQSLQFKDYNLVFVSFDALQAAHVGSLGYPRDVTPTIDAMAKQGFSFRNNTSVASWTVPASMTWFTGVYPSEHRMTNKYAVFQPPITKIANLKELSPDLVTLADVLTENGYATGGFTGNAGVSGGFGYEQGFDEYYYEKGKFGRMDQSIPRALVWLRANKDKKFFLFLHGYDIHGQSTPADGFDYRFVDKDYDRRYTGAELEQELLREEGLEKGQLTMREEDVRFWRAIYDEKIQRTDEAFKQFLSEFDQLGLTGKTIFVLTSDHGTEFYEHRRFDHGFTLYQELIHVPLIIKVPGKNIGRTIDDRVSSIDVMPTILDLLDVNVSEKAKRQLRGTSLVPAMQGERIERDVFSETDYREYTYKRSIITPDGWKLIYTMETQTRELYDLTGDPGETKNLVNSRAKSADELQRRLFTHFKSIGRDLHARDWKTGLNPVYPSQAPD